MADRILNIPGYYYDLEKKKYFKITRDLEVQKPLPKPKKRKITPKRVVNWNNAESQSKSTLYLENLFKYGRFRQITDGFAFPIESLINSPLRKGPDSLIYRMPETHYYYKHPWVYHSAKTVQDSYLTVTISTVGDLFNASYLLEIFQKDGSRSKIRTFYYNDKDLYCAKFLGNHLVLSASDGLYRIDCDYSLHLFEQTESKVRCKSNVFSMDDCDDKNCLYLGNRNGQLQIFDDRVFGLIDTNIKTPASIVHILGSQRKPAQVYITDWSSKTYLYDCRFAKRYILKYQCNPSTSNVLYDLKFRPQLTTTGNEDLLLKLDTNENKIYIYDSKYAEILKEVELQNVGNSFYVKMIDAEDNLENLAILDGYEKTDLVHPYGLYIASSDPNANRCSSYFYGV
jgi:hypothetical protein